LLYFFLFNSARTDAYSKRSSRFSQTNLGLIRPVADFAGQIVQVVFRKFEETGGSLFQQK
jgi:hypothetical protein